MILEIDPLRIKKKNIFSNKHYLLYKVCTNSNILEVGSCMSSSYVWMLGIVTSKDIKYITFKGLGLVQIPQK